MPCFHPLEAWQLEDGKVVFVERGKVRRPLVLACGQCIGCRLERSRQWAVRILHESQMYFDNSFITLTYAPDKLSHPSLNYRDFQLFCKRLRFKYGRFRFFMCGEYGELYKRPHYHACLFGVHFSDRKLYSELSSGFRLYTSKALSDLWPHGFSSVGDVSFESAAYVARYIMKKVTGNRASIHYREWPDYATGELVEVVPEFCHMSLKPGIGSTWFDKFRGDVFPHDRVIVRGHACKVPRYYDRKEAKLNPYEFENLQFERERKSDLYLEDTTAARLAVREEVTKARLKFKLRTLE